MLTRDGKVKLLDLGVARVASSDPGAATRSSNEVVPSRAGTPAYMAPERLGGHPADARTDVYSAGVVLFELLTGARPYLAPDLMTLAVNVATHPTPRVASKRKDVPPALDELIARAMSKDPKTRIPSAAEFHKGLARVRDTRSGRRSGPELGPAWRRRLVITLATIAGLALVAWLLWPALRRSPAAAPVPATIAIPPVANDSIDQPDLDELASLLQSVLSRNLAALPDVTIVTGTLPSPSGGAPAGGQPAPGAGYTVALRVRRAVSGISADVALMRPGDARPLWQDHLAGDALDLLRAATDKVAAALERNAGSRMMTSEIRARMRALPTANSEALREYLQGRVVLDTSDLGETDQKAAALFESAIKRDESFAFAHAGLSLTYSSLFKHTREARWLDDATNAARRALAIDSRADQAYVASALAFRAAKKKNEAVLEARQAVDLTPDSDDGHRVLGLALFDHDERDAAIAELQLAVRLRPRHWSNHYYLGWALLTAHRIPEAIDPLTKAKDLLSSFESTYVNLGFAHLSLGNWDQAIGNSNLALQRSPKDSSAVTNLATAYYWQGRYGDALANYQKAQDWDPNNAKRYMNLGDTYGALGRRAEAHQAYVTAVEKAAPNLDDATTAAIAAKCEAKLGHAAKAESLALSAVSTAGNDPDVAYKAAVVFALKPDVETAMKYLKLAVDNGYSLYFVRDDPDLRSLSNHPQFKSLIAPIGR